MKEMNDLVVELFSYFLVVVVVEDFHSVLVMFYLMYEKELKKKRILVLFLFLFIKEKEYIRFPPTLAIRIPADLHQPTGKISRDE